MPPKIDLTLIPPPETVFANMVSENGGNKKYAKSPHPSRLSRTETTDEKVSHSPSENASEGPSYPLCKDLRAFLDPDTHEWWISCCSIFDELEDGSAKPTKMDRCRKAGQGKKPFAHELRCDIVPNKRWTTGQWTDEISSKGPEWVVEAETVKDFVIWALGKRRIASAADRQRLARKFDIDTETTKIPVAIEQSMIDYLKEVLPCHIKTQYRIGTYRLDAYIEDYRVAIQIDEHGHASYDRDGESKMDDFLRKECIVVIRFNPHAKHGMDPKVKLARTVIERLLSPEFVSFRRERGLFSSST